MPLENLDDLEREWEEFMFDRPGKRGTWSQDQRWRADNPGKLQQLLDYRAGGARPDFSGSPQGSPERRMLEHLDAWHEAKAQPEPPPPPPPPPSGLLLGLVPNAGFPGTGNGGTLAARLRPAEIREDHLSAALVDWAGENGSGVIGLATGKDTAGTLALLTQYPAIRVWELDNEPYFAGVDLAAWSRKMRDTAKAIKARDAGIEVLCPVNASVNGGDYQTGGVWSPWVTQMLNAAADLPQYVDGWAAHPYPNPRNAPPQFGLLEKVKGQLEGRGAMRPFSVTEVGWSVGTATGPKGQVTLQQQADYLRQFVDGARARPWLRRCVIYSLRSWGPGFEESFGLHNPDGSQRPAAAEFLALGS